MRTSSGRLAILVGVVLTAGALGASSASASYHEVKIGEVRIVNGTGDFAELQMYTDGQNLIAGHYLRIYTFSGSTLVTFQFPSNVPNGQSQRTILIGDNTVAGADFNSASIGFDVDGGAVCYLDSLGTPDVGTPDTGIDCLAWGDFDGTFNDGTPSPTGSNAAPGGGLFNNTLTRSITGGCATALDPADDTNDGAADFTVASGAGTPRGNAAAPTETLCATLKPKKKCKKKGKGKSAAAAKKKCKKKKKKKKK